MVKPNLDFQKTQQLFSDAIRDPQQSVIDIEVRRLKIYQDLFFNNIESFIAGSFPVLKEIINEEDWRILVRDFFIHHSCDSPYFLKISEEFLTYLETARFEFLPEFTQQLAHWEWMELFADVYVDEQQLLPEATLDFNTGIYQTINTAWAQVYEYPVHKISQDYQSVEKAPVFLLIHRNADFQVGFIELNPLSYLLFLSLIDNQQKTLTQLLLVLAHEHGMDPEVVLTGGQAILSQWCEHGLITEFV